MAIYARRYLLGTNITSNAPPSSRAAEVPEPPPMAVTPESDSVVILAAMLCALVCVVGLIAVARCAWLRRGYQGRSAGGGLSHRSANKGLKKKVLNSLPKYTYSSENKASTEAEAVTVDMSAAEDCAICLSEYADGEEIRVLPHCGHVFHLECIDTWLGSHSSCPSCRQILAVTRCRKCGDFPTTVGSAAAAEGGGGEDGGCGYSSAKARQLSSSSSSSSTTSSPTFLP